MVLRDTDLARSRYQRVSIIYDLFESIPERIFSRWRKRLWADVHGPKVLEVGVGTGRNIPFYPPGLDITAVDLTPGMLDRAKNSAEKLGCAVRLQLGDAQALDFADNTFDSAAATFVFCSVPDPLKGLQEISRILRKNGRVYLLEHVRSENRVLGALMDFLNPLTRSVMGTEINRRTVDTVSKAGLRLVSVENLSKAGIFKYIVAQKE